MLCVGSAKSVPDEGLPWTETSHPPSLHSGIFPRNRLRFILDFGPEAGPNLRPPAATQQLAERDVIPSSRINVEMRVG